MNTPIVLKREEKQFYIGNNLPLTLIAGPCSLESREHAMKMCKSIKDICDKLSVNFIFKVSFDKANRTSVESPRGVGLYDSIDIFREIKDLFQVPILTDIHESWQSVMFAQNVDILQIPAFLCRQTDLLVAAGKTGKVVNVKKGQFMAPWDMENVVKKIESTGNKRIMLTDRGASFGYNTLVSDMRALPIMAKTGYPVIFDATHSVQQPSGQGGISGGQREFVPHLARAAVATGVAGVFMEVHDDPKNALSDAACQWPLNDLEELLVKLIEIDRVVK